MFLEALRAVFKENVAVPKRRSVQSAAEFQVMFFCAKPVSNTKSSAAGFEEENLTKVHDEWYQIFEASFEQCDLPIMKKHGSFSQTSWPRRIESVIKSMEKHFIQ